MVTEAEFRAMALAMPEAEEKEHFEQPDFRVKNKIFAGLRPQDGRAVLKLPKDEAFSLAELDPKTFEPAKGWERGGWTLIVLARANKAQLSELIDTAWRQVAPRKLAIAHSTRRR